MAEYWKNGVFKQDIELLSKRSSKEHVYPRPDLLNLDSYLSDMSFQHPVADSPYARLNPVEPTVLNSFVVIHDIQTGTSTPFEASAKGSTEFFAHSAPEGSGSSLLFIRGFASPRWLGLIGEKHHLSPELCRRHLEFPAFNSGARDLYSSPSLPSSSSRVFQLTIPTICTRNVGVSGYQPEDLQESRRLEEEAMNRYSKQLRSKSHVGDSMVRKCLLFSKQHYVIEQTISIDLGPPGEDWRALVWLDSGKDLSESLAGPWSPWPGTRPWETYFFPVIVHQGTDLAPHSRKDSSLHLNSSSIFPTSAQVSRTNEDGEEEWRAGQNICLLPFQYGQNLDKSLASKDALYALSEIFHFAASAEVQFLNLMHKRIDCELSFVGKDGGRYHSLSLLNLKYIQTQLTSHAQSLSETIGILENRKSLDWPRVDDPPPPETVAVLLLADFTYLLKRAETLARQCEQGMTTLANSSMLEESRRSATMAMTVQRLTIIGTIFIPMSFVCSVWGTNFKEFGSGSQPIWMLAASTTPVILFSYSVYRWDVVVRMYRKILLKMRNTRNTRIYD